MKLGFTAVERILRDVHKIADADAVAFRARLRNLPRAGLKVTEPEGSGRRANFTIDAVYKLAFGLELLEVGLPPESAAILAAHNWPAAAEELLAAHADRMKNPRELSSRYLVVEPRLISRKKSFGVGRVAFAKKTAKRLSEEIASQGSLRTARLIILNMTALLLQIEAAMQRVGISSEDIREELSRAAALERRVPPKSGFIPTGEQ